MVDVGGSVVGGRPASWENVHCDCDGVRWWIKAASPEDWKRVLLRTRRRAKSQVFALPGGGSLERRGQMKGGQSLAQVDLKPGREAEVVGPTRES